MKDIEFEFKGIIEGMPHYSVTCNNPSRAAKKIKNKLDFSTGKASVAFWSKGLPELYYISTFIKKGNGEIEEKEDYTFSTV